MRILFVPMTPAPITAATVEAHPYATPLSHLIPLLALNRMLPPTVRTAFLLKCPAVHRRKSVDVLAIDHRGELETELEAYRQFRPDVVVDDFGLTTGRATTITGIPRITLARTSIFKGYVPRNPGQRHSLEVDPSGTDASGIPLPKTISDLFQASRYIVTGIPTVEPLPPALRGDAAYVFGGPLLLPRSDARAQGFAPRGPGRREIAAFCEAQRAANRPVVFLTTGTNWKPEARRPMVARLLDLGVALLSTCVVDGLPRPQQARYFADHFLSMHDACAHADVVVHQCGNGTYHYPMMHAVPGVTIGSGCFDRDDIALRLEELGVSIHVPFRRDGDRVQSIVDAVRASIGRKRAADYRRAAAPLRREIRRVSAAFDFHALLRGLVEPRAVRA